MSPLSLAIFLLSISFEIVLIWRFGQNGLWKSYGWLLAYLAYTLLVMDFGSFVVYHFFPGFYPNWYWNSESLSMGLRFCVLWEIFRHTFSEASSLNKLVSRALAAGSSIPILLSFLAFWSLLFYISHDRLHYLYPALERSFGLVQAFLLAGIMAAAQYYRVRLGRNMWGLALGFGAFVSISTVIFSLVNLTGSFAPYMQVLSPLSFVSMLAIWTWSLWVYAPNPSFAINTTRAENAAVRWWGAWAHMLTVIKRTTHI